MLNSKVRNFIFMEHCKNLFSFFFFFEFLEFVEEVEKYGVVESESLAMEMKKRVMYMARQLSSRLST